MSDRTAIRSTNAALSKKRLRLWLRILKVQRQVEAELRSRLRDRHGTTLPRFDVLAALDRSENGLKMSELSKVLMVSNGNVTGIVDRLEEEELLARETVERDRRATIVRLTPKGRRHFVELAAEHEVWVNDLLAGLGKADAEQALDLLTRLDRAISDSGRQS
ncbi:MAG: hypothetical protein RL291_326 [Pseudomonadota bacterium]|jgi:DNA-binding MarR family transcriptional regulator